MYRRQKRGSGCLRYVIILGVVVGIVYFLQSQSVQLPTANLLLLPTSTPMIQVEATGMAAAVLPVATDEPSVLLVIPKANVGAKVVPVFTDDTGNWDVSQLGGNVGHLEGTAWLSHPGNIGLVAHVELKDGRPGIFVYLKTLQVGDEVLLIESGQNPRTYHVDNVQTVQPYDLSVLYPSTKDELTLITCDSYDLLSNSYLTRTVITATRFS